MNRLPWKKRAEIKRLLALGASHRAIAQVVNVAKNTVTNHAAIWRFSVTCQCGRPSGHKGWCAARLEFSPNRRGWLQEQWERRSGSELAVTVDRAYQETTALGHKLGRFVWGSSATTTIAYALCSTCGKSVRVNRGDGRRDLLDGTAVREVCSTAAERAAERAASEEKREWRKARRTIAEIYRHLHPRNSRTAASSPEPTSRA